MKVKTSITLSTNILRIVDRMAAGSEQYRSRSEFIETAIRAFIAQLARAERNARDLEILNRHADRLNREAEDVLAYQVAL